MIGKAKWPVMTVTLLQTVLYTFDVPPAHALDLTPHLQIGAYLFVVQNAEAVDQGEGLTHISESVPYHLRHMQRAGVVQVSKGVPPDRGHRL